MKIKSLMIFIVLLFGITFCAPSKFYIDEGFSGMNPKASLIITQVNEIDISQDYELYTLENLRKVRNLFYEYQRAIFPSSVKNVTKFKSTITSDYKLPPQFEKKEFIVNEKEKVELLVPKSSIKYENEGIFYVLFFQDYKIGFDLEETDTSDPAKTLSTEKLPGLNPQLKPNKLYKPLFTIRTKYFIYDNENSKVVLAGNAVIKERFTPEMNLDNVIAESLNGLAKRIFEKTPFEE
ncbi:MAG: hypothetical protein GYA14_05400 [Ignavibacteria bacterium]|nr:hypothetical protein [Ignavibacteria bacterium]